MPAVGTALATDRVTIAQPKRCSPRSTRGIAARERNRGRRSVEDPLAMVPT